ncbi:MAG: 2,3-bisphosphoglycerate-independent phosphoglycerate mutase [Verrucomicrobia bacterium]|nr:2,3-bisphosphoglycerate-independent phosphoglycerate mutase [Verrucomicrobiota bacterium]
MSKPVLLLIRDGWGINPAGRNGAEKQGDATLLAKTPVHDRLYKVYPWGRLQPSGLKVGLPEGQMGNSEVGHLNLGAGRIVYQELTRINLAIGDASGKRLHLIGLVSDGGVHSHLDHLLALLRIAGQSGSSELFVHAITDGRDVSPTSGREFLRTLEQAVAKIPKARVATVIGRYYAMDRDKRWERVQLAHDLFLEGKGAAGTSGEAALAASYAAGVTDEFVKPFVLPGIATPVIRDGDVLFFFNFRADRMRQIVRSLADPSFNEFPITRRPKTKIFTLTPYEADFTRLGIRHLFSPVEMNDLLGEVVAAQGLKQARMAETEKYPHVTYFFNGGKETPNPGEERIMAPSPKVATYDLQPEMSAIPLTEKVVERIEKGLDDLIILNYANPDMVGHTGVLNAAIKAVETIDACTGRVLDALLKKGGKALVTADHGNCEQMLQRDGSPHTAHTTNLVHCLYVAADSGKFKVADGILADVAPTLLEMLGLAKPSAMTGSSLLQKK